MASRQSGRSGDQAEPASHRSQIVNPSAQASSVGQCRQRREEDGDSIKERLREALAQHKDASEADHVRESEERTKQELADVKRELAAMAATQQIILTKLQTILDDKQQS